MKVGLITKTDTNPFFVKMKEGAEEAAARRTAPNCLPPRASSTATTPGQVTAIENMIAAGVKTILITPSDARRSCRRQKARARASWSSRSTRPPIRRRHRRPLRHRQLQGRRQLIGQYAKAAMGGKPAKIVTLDLLPAISVGVQRHNGFLKGFGAQLTATPRREDSADVVCEADTYGDQAKGQTAMENCLQKSPDINVVYTINEPAAAGAYNALKAAGKEKDVLIVSVDGGCAGIQASSDGKIAATSQQYPLKMAAWASRPSSSPRKDGKKASGYTDTGVTLITDKALAGVESKDTAFGLENCWGSRSPKRARHSRSAGRSPHSRTGKTALSRRSVGLVLRTTDIS